MSGNSPQYHIQPPNRQKSFSSKSRLGAYCEWITTTWFRFNVAIASCFILFAAIFDETLAIGERAIMVILCVPTAIVLVPLWKIMLLLISFVPLISIPFAFLRLLYFSLFSRLVRESAPLIVLPLWYARH